MRLRVRPRAPGEPPKALRIRRFTLKVRCPECEGEPYGDDRQFAEVCGRCMVTGEIEATLREVLASWLPRRVRRP